MKPRNSALSFSTRMEMRRKTLNRRNGRPSEISRLQARRAGKIEFARQQEGAGHVEGFEPSLGDDGR